jgi:hypothetical protein
MVLVATAELHDGELLMPIIADALRLFADDLEKQAAGRHETENHSYTIGNRQVSLTYIHAVTDKME